jgi:hypothetical protein
MGKKNKNTSNAGTTGLPAIHIGTRVRCTDDPGQQRAPRSGVERPGNRGPKLPRRQLACPG